MPPKRKVGPPNGKDVYFCTRIFASASAVAVFRRPSWPNLGWVDGWASLSAALARSRDGRERNRCQTEIASPGTPATGPNHPTTAWRTRLVPAASPRSAHRAMQTDGGERPAVKAKPRVEKNRVLVTGGAGFVGSHLCDFLVNRGDHVRRDETMRGHAQAAPPPGAPAPRRPRAPAPRPCPAASQPTNPRPPPHHPPCPQVICLDNFFTGSRENVAHLLGRTNFELLRHDVVEKLLLEVDQVYHLACPASPVHYK